MLVESVVWWILNIWLFWWLNNKFHIYIYMTMIMCWCVNQYFLTQAISVLLSCQCDLFPLSKIMNTCFMSCECNILLRPALILFASGAGAVEGQATAAPAWENILSVLCNGFELIARSVLKAFWEQVFVFLSSPNQPRQWKIIHL